MSHLTWLSGVKATTNKRAKLTVIEVQAASYKINVTLPAVPYLLPFLYQNVLSLVMIFDLLDLFDQNSTQKPNKC